MLDTVINLPAVILGFGALIFFHELGHFVAAKWAGVQTGSFCRRHGASAFVLASRHRFGGRIHPGPGG